MSANLDSAERKFLDAGPGERLAAGLALADVLISDSQHDRALALLDELEPLSGDDQQSAALLWRTGEVRFRQSNFDEAYRVLGEALSRLTSQPASMELFNVYRVMSWVFYRQGYLERAHSFCDGAAGVLALHRDEQGRDIFSARATLYHTMALIEGGAGNKEAAIGHYQDESAILEQSGDRSRLAPVYINLCNLHYGQGRLAKSLELLRAALDLLSDSGDTLLQSIVYNNLGGLYVTLGNLAAARDYYQRQMELNRKIEYLIGDAFALAGLARVSLFERDLAGAEKQYLQALSLVRSVAGKGKEASILTELAELYCEWERYDQAQGHLDQAVQMIAETEEKESSRHRALGARIMAARAVQAAPAERGRLLAEAAAILERASLEEPVLASEEVVTAAEVKIEAARQLALVRRAEGNQCEAGAALDRAGDLITEFVREFPAELKQSFLRRPDIKAIEAWRREHHGTQTGPKQ
jgi:tetratricopeptide (TPR) repeat protein